MILINIDSALKEPIYKQIIQQLALLIDQGSLRPGDRLPPTRQLAGQLGVHRSTVVRAYDELWALGYLNSRQGAYSTVRKKQKALSASPAQSAQLFNWHTAQSPTAARAIAKVWPENPCPPKASCLDFESFDLDSRMIPVEAIRKSLNHALCDEGAELLRYGPSGGYRPLRELIARRLGVHAIHVSPDEILITHGAQHGMDLALRLLTQPGQTIAIEDPTYGMFMTLAETHQLTVRGIPMLSGGMDLDQLEHALQTEPIKLIYTMPNFHNPTGITTNQAHRERLLRLCQQHQVVIVEDAFDEEMKYFGRVPLPIKSMDQHGLVIYLGTFSKVLSPGMRLGWIAAPKPCIEMMTQLRRALDLSSPLPLQAAITRILRRDDFEKHIQRLHRAFRHRMQAAIRTLKAELPRQVEWHSPSGGYLLWLTLKGLHMAEADVIQALTEAGIRVSPGSRFRVQAVPWPSFRLSISQRDEEEIVHGLSILGKTITRLYGQSKNEVIS